MEQNNISVIEARVMANVGVVYSVRQVFSATAIKAYVLVAALFALWRLVWVSRVFQNFANVEKNGLASIGNFVVHALLHTSPVVQVTLAVGIISFALLVVDLFRSISLAPARQLSI